MINTRPTHTEMTPPRHRQATGSDPAGGDGYAGNDRGDFHLFRSLGDRLKGLGDKIRDKGRQLGEAVEAGLDVVGEALFPRPEPELIPIPIPVHPPRRH